MHKILIVEDDTEQLNLLYDSIQNQYPDWNIRTAQTYEQAEELLQASVREPSYFTLFLFDIRLSSQNDDRSGFFLAQKVRKEPPYFMTPILFLTAVSDEMHLALSKFHCYNYITKPYTPEDILKQLEQMLLTGHLQNALEFTDINRIRHKIFINDIFMIESKSHAVMLHTSSGNYITREFSLESILKMLGNNFIQCHRKNIVNKKYINHYDKSSKYIQIDDILIPVGRTYAKKLNL